ncbi:MAG: hypothetical protein F2681_01085 [Actinobacteria bacterium]|uniref:Unannotated protein n=1 Tax=freshwater metagenome TaxID=449393 RepID=A0A6J6A5J9_9ZZZZ|nr:hypothetical protein [Actinomycetota bacterium]MSW77674.1 hypothetical protein [Actinomycetota bacterium]MSX56279.1 hypothetical protein [Actinomycetota bacterium]MSX93369.1 hypothetical protein [Actinomycetota bacterium]MSZ81718.1 hypothetical protein [Actinomycetota bacterium]
MRRSFVLGALGLIAMAGVAVGCSDSKTASTTTAGGGDVTVPSGAEGTPVAVVAADTSATTQTLTADPISVAAGQVTFTFQNTGTKQHEMIILKTDDAIDALVVGADDKVSEAASVGEISETDAGKTVTKTFPLAAGKYILVCNIAKHYAQGMRVAFTVTG